MYPYRSNSDDFQGGGTDDLDTVTSLERRQEVILQRLECLKNVLQGLKSKYKTPDTPDTSVTSNLNNRPAGKPMDLVIVEMSFIKS